MDTVAIVIAWILFVGFGGAALVATVTTLVAKVVRYEQGRKLNRQELGADLEDLFGSDQE